MYFSNAGLTGAICRSPAIGDTPSMALAVKRANRKTMTSVFERIFRKFIRRLLLFKLMNKTRTFVLIIRRTTPMSREYKGTQLLNIFFFDKNQGGGRRRGQNERNREGDGRAEFFPEQAGQKRR